MTTSESNIEYWTERAEQCFAIADEVERTHRRDARVRKITKVYRLAANNWRNAASRATSDDPISRDMVDDNARDGAHFEAIAHQRRHDLDGTPIPAEVTAYPAPPQEEVAGRVIGSPISWLALNVEEGAEVKQGREVLHMGHFYSSTLYRTEGRWMASYYDRDKSEADWRQLTDAEATAWEWFWL